MGLVGLIFFVFADKVRFRQDLVQHLWHDDRIAEGAIGRGLVVLFGEVALAEDQGILVRGLGDVMEKHLHRKQHLRCAESAERTVGNGVRAVDVAADVEVINRVDAG